MHGEFHSVVGAQPAWAMIKDIFGQAGFPDRRKSIMRLPGNSIRKTGIAEMAQTRQDAGFHMPCSPPSITMLCLVAEPLMEI
jgi:hypothetical protein